MNHVHVCCHLSQGGLQNVVNMFLYLTEQQLEPAGLPAPPPPPIPLPPNPSPTTHPTHVRVAGVAPHGVEHGELDKEVTQ